MLSDTNTVNKRTQTTTKTKFNRRFFCIASKIHVHRQIGKPLCKTQSLSYIRSILFKRGTTHFLLFTNCIINHLDKFLLFVLHISLKWEFQNFSNTLPKGIQAYVKRWQRIRFIFFTVFLRITQLMVFFLFILSVAKIRLFLYRSEFPSAQSGERTKWTAIGKGG